MRKIRNFSHYGNQGFPNHPNHQIWRHSKKEILKVRKNLIITLSLMLILSLILPLASAITGKISSAKIIVSGNVGDVIEKQITIYNNENTYPVNIKLTSSSNNIVISNDSFILNPGEEKVISFNISINKEGYVEENIFVKFEAIGEGSLIIKSQLLITGKTIENKKDIAYVVNNNADQNLVSFMDDSGYSFDIINVNNLDSINWSNYKVLLLGDQKFSGFITQLPVNNMPSLILDRTDLNKWGWTKYSSAWVSSNKPPTVWVYNRDNLIVQGISQFFKPYDYNGIKVDEFKIYYIRDYTKVNTIVADDVGILGRPKKGAVIATINTGDRLANGEISNSRGVFFGVSNTELWTEDTKQIFDKSIRWLIDGNDKDGDGYSLEEGDCDDENPLINPGSENPLLNCINDAPVQKEVIPNLSWISGETRDLNLNDYFEDPDEDNLVFSISETSENEYITATFLANGHVLFENTGNWTGSDWIIFKATDTGNLFVVSNNVTLTVTSEIEIPEIKINEFVSEPLEGADWIEFYNPNDVGVDLSNCKIRDGSATNELGLSGAIASKSFSVFEWDGKLNKDGDIIKLYCNEELVDSVSYGNWNDGNLTDNAPAPGEGESAGRNPDGKDSSIDSGDFIIFTFPTKGLANIIINDEIPPEVVLISPEDNSIFTETRNIVFNFNASDNLANLIYCELKVDGDIKASKNTANGIADNFQLGNLADGSHSWNVRCSDGKNYASAEDDWSFEINAPDAPVLNSIGAKTIMENETLEFSINGSDPDGDGIRFYAENLPTGAEFNSTTMIFSWTPNLNQAGIYYIDFFIEDTTTLKDSERVKINVTNFNVPPVPLNFDDADTCSIVDKNIEVKIKEPDNSDDFEIGDEITIDVEIKNNAEQDADLNVKAYLYDLDDNKVIDDDNDDLSVNKGRKDNIELTVDAPEDADTKNDFAIYVIASEDSDKFCNSNYTRIDIKRAREDLKIKNVVVSPEEIKKGENARVEVKVQNIGEDELDVTIYVKNSELKIDEQTEEFQLEGFDGDDTETKTISIEIPKDAVEKIYDLEITAEYDGENKKEVASINVVSESADDGSDSEGEILKGGLINLNNQNIVDIVARESSRKIELDEPLTKISVELKEKEAEKSPEKVSAKKSSFLDILTKNKLSFGLIAGIIILLILIMIVLVNRR